nr:N-6 DNA methylase [Bacillus subtilis]
MLIQEIFKNSNFTNNVQSGNLSEIIEAVNDIDEDRLLNTDLLGDAIESALSEQGGTKDIGLYRTPDHIRQFMIGLLEPTIKDSIFDPACGTGGFLFDGFGFVMEAISQDGTWSGTKAHPELQQWFKEYFKNHPAPMPTIEESTQFYRSGISGIEYLGMIRKMASVNFYVRGLNPHNILQGDSLALFDYTLSNSKSIIPANPPFGAERDQEAYPNVWEEFSAESETTILFVKMMIDSLRPGGKCAVIVSEGFLTWDQSSARTLRKMLLDELNLIGVIGLPQGVFVSKSGPGPKTSILLFEKSTPSENVWFYQVTNDGYSMGTNRKVIEGSQLVEALDIYHNYVKQGKIPPTTKNSMVVPVKWIKTLDPRIKQRIRQETIDSLEEKREKEKAKLIKSLNTRKKSGRLTSTEYEHEIWKFESTWESKINNEIAKRIDRAHLYSLNSVNYKANLVKERLEKWEEIVQSYKSDEQLSLDKRYSLLKRANLKKAINYLANFNPNNPIELDIIKTYIKEIPDNEIGNYPELAEISQILTTNEKYPVVKLGDYIIENRNKVKPAEDPEVDWRLLGVSNEVGIFLNEGNDPTETKQSYYIVEKGHFCYNPYRINVGSIGYCELNYSNQLISGAYVVFGTKENDLDSQFLNVVTKTDKFKKYVNEKANTGNGVRMNFKYEHLCDFEFPLPPLDVQKEIVEKVSRQQAIINSVDTLIANFEFEIPPSEDKRTLGDFIEDSLYGISEKLLDDGKYPVLRMNNLDTKGYWHLDDLKYTNSELSEHRRLKKGDFIFNRTNSVELVGKSAVVDFDMEGSWAGYLIRIKLNKELNPHYLRFLFTNKRYRDHFSTIAKPAGGQANINAEELAATKIDYYPIEEQNKIVENMMEKSRTLDSVQKLKYEAQKRIDEIINQIWG